MSNESTPNINNIGIVTATYGSKGGGGDIHFRNLIPYWESLGAKVTNLQPIIINKFTFFTVLKSTIKVAFMRTANFFDINKYDIIASVSPYPMDLILALKLARKYKKPLTIYIHHIPPGILIHPFKRGFIRVLLNTLYISTVISLLDHLEIPIFLDNPNTLNKPRLKVYPNLIAIQKNNVDKIQESEIKYDICYIGRIENHKGVEDIINVVKILKQTYSMAPKVILAGKGKDRYVAGITKIITEMGLYDNIILKGYVSEDEKYHLLLNSKVFLFLSYEEGWSISVMEAASIGTPIVAYSLPAYYYLKGNYYSVPVGDIMACAEKLKQVFSNYAQAKDMGFRAKKCVETFSYEFIAKQQLIFFKRIIKDFLMTK